MIRFGANKCDPSNIAAFVVALPSGVTVCIFNGLKSPARHSRFFAVITSRRWHAHWACENCFARSFDNCRRSVKLQLVPSLRVHDGFECRDGFIDECRQGPAVVAELFQ